MPVFCLDRKSTRLNSSHLVISYAVFCLKKNQTKSSDVAKSVDPERFPSDASPLALSARPSYASGRASVVGPAIRLLYVFFFFLIEGAPPEFSPLPHPPPLRT